LVFKCPVTGINVITDINVREGDEQSLQQLIFGIACPCCQMAHQFSADQCRKTGRSAAA